ncbi:MAG: beta-ketoacyl-ACP synthase II [Chloroflexi bacterium]|nr:beta-ketoacyl-ACP synthase II [Chloroflexota bacterium]
MSKRIVVTGMGCVTPLGLDMPSTWQGMIEGRSGVGYIKAWDTSAHEVKIGGECPEFSTAKIMNPKEARRIDRFAQFGLVSAVEAWEHSGMTVTPENAEMVGCIAGSGIGGIDSLGKGFETLFTKTPDRVTPFLVVQMLIDLLPGHVSMLLGLKGPNFSVVSACATSGNAIGEAAEVIKRGDADVMLAGGADAGVVPIGIAAFHAMRALSTRNDEPRKASRPFDKDRDGFVMSESGGMVVLEELEHAKARGATIHAELIGYGMSADAHHVSAPAEDGEGAARAMRMALRKAGLTPKDIGYINAHATSTPLGDRSETSAIKSVFGPAAYDVAISSTKSMTGHLLGAAGVVEAIACIKAIQDGILPPTINLDEPDPACDLDYIPNVARKRQIAAALSNSFGFGGHNSSLIFTKYQG